MKRALVLSAPFFLFAPSVAAAQVDAPTTPAEASPPPPPPTPAPTPDPPSPQPANGEKKWASIVGARLDGAYALRKLYDISIKGADIGGAIGAQPLEHGAFWGTVRVMIGSTESGLSFWDVHVGAEGEGVIDRFRFGGGIGGYMLGISRVTANQTIRTWGPEIRAFVRVDVVQSDGFALFVRGAVQAGFEFYDSATIWGPSIGAGVDFDLKGKRPSE